MRRALKLSYLIVVLMVAQSLLGLSFRDQYRDVEWIKATWFGNDLVTLLVAVPVFVASLTLARSGSARGLLLWFGVLGYGVYNYAYYMLGASLNVFFALYVVLAVLSAVALIVALSDPAASAIAQHFSDRTPNRAIGGYLVFVAIGLSVVWFGMWAAYVFAGTPTPVEPEAFRLVAALDTSLMVPTLGVGCVLLWRRASWGWLIAGIGSVQGSLYLVVLSLNSGIAIYRGVVEAPGELWVWGTLALFTTVAAVVLLGNASGGVRFDVGDVRAAPSDRPPVPEGITR